MEIFLQAVILIIIVVIFKNLRWGLALYIAYSFLVPYCKLGFGGFVLQQNLINTVILFSAWLTTKQFDLKPFRAFIVFYILILLVIPFTNGISADYQIDRWRGMIMLNLFVPIAMWNMRCMKDAYVPLRICIIVTIIISCVYGLFLTTMGGINPYAMIFYALNGEDYLYEWFGAGTRLFGRISSVFTHPMSYGMFLGCTLIYIYHLRDKISKYLYYGLMTLILINILICGVRSLLFASLITFIFFFIACGKIKIILGLSLVASVIALVVVLTPELYEYFNAVSDVSDQNEIGGSSLDMRLSQLDGCFREIKDCFLVGKGHMWHEYYLVKFEEHPVIFGFESLLFIIICDYGMFGFFIYGIMLLILLQTQNKYIKGSLDRLTLNCYIVFYLSYCILTGDYSYMKIWLIFYYLTFSEMYILQKKDVTLKK